MKVTISIRGPVMEHKKRVWIFIILLMVSLLLVLYKTVPVACKAHRMSYYDIAFLPRPRPCASKEMLF